MVEIEKRNDEQEGVVVEMENCGACVISSLQPY